MSDICQRCFPRSCSCRLRVEPIEPGSPADLFNRADPGCDACDGTGRVRVRNVRGGLAGAVIPVGEQCPCTIAIVVGLDLPWLPDVEHGSRLRLELRDGTVRDGVVDHVSAAGDVIVRDVTAGSRDAMLTLAADDVIAVTPVGSDGRTALERLAGTPGFTFVDEAADRGLELLAAIAGLLDAVGGDARGIGDALARVRNAAFAVDLLGATIEASA